MNKLPKDVLIEIHRYIHRQNIIKLNDEYNIIRCSCCNCCAPTPNNTRDYNTFIKWITLNDYRMIIYDGHRLSIESYFSYFKSYFIYEYDYNSKIQATRWILRKKNLKDIHLAWDKIYNIKKARKNYRRKFKNIIHYGYAAVVGCTIGHIMSYHI